MQTTIHQQDRTRSRAGLNLWVGGLIVTGLAVLVIATAAPRLTGQEVVTMTEHAQDLTPEEKMILIHKGTEPAFSGRYCEHKETGTYNCRNCNTPLFKSGDKFDSGCGWPSFDDAVPDAVKETLDVDGSRTEITCAACGGHLGHVFVGEKFTDRNTRHCVNSISLSFVPGETSVAQATAYFAGGCFWGVEHYLNNAEGVISARSGYMGGHLDNPNYQEICDGQTGHVEAVEVVFDPTVISYDKLARLFFEIHDPTQVDRQGPDVGHQYRSAIFYTDDHQKQVAAELIGILKAKGFPVVTELAPADKFWPAEDYHQDYYGKTGRTPYCHAYQKRF